MLLLQSQAAPPRLNACVISVVTEMLFAPIHAQSVLPEMRAGQHKNLGSISGAPELNLR